MEKIKVDRVYSILSKTYKIFEENDNDWDSNGLSENPFKSLISVKLSTMTYTSRVIKACLALYSKADTPEAILKLSDDELRELIKPVAHYNRKTLHIKEMCQQLLDRHNGQVPKTREDLMALQGVGRKCVDILMNFTFNKNAIAVDSHVQRVVNRIGFVHTSTNDKTADKLMEITPQKYVKHAHEWLIQHGMKTCIARKPKCCECKVNQLCEYDKKTQ